MEEGATPLQWGADFGRRVEAGWEVEGRAVGGGDEAGQGPDPGQFQPWSHTDRSGPSKWHTTPTLDWVVGNHPTGKTCFLGGEQSWAWGLGGGGGGREG